MVRSHVSQRADDIRPYGFVGTILAFSSEEKVARLAEPDEVDTRKSGTLFADELRSAHELTCGRELRLRHTPSSPLRGASPP